VAPLFCLPVPPATTACRFCGSPLQPARCTAYHGPAPAFYCLVPLTTVSRWPPACHHCHRYLPTTSSRRATVWNFATRCSAYCATCHLPARCGLAVCLYACGDMPLPPHFLAFFNADSLRTYTYLLLTPPFYLPANNASFVLPGSHHWMLPHAALPAGFHTQQTFFCDGGIPFWLYRGGSGGCRIPLTLPPLFLPVTAPRGFCHLPYIPTVLPPFFGRVPLASNNRLLFHCLPGLPPPVAIPYIYAFCYAALPHTAFAIPSPLASTCTPTFLPPPRSACCRCLPNVLPFVPAPCRSLLCHRLPAGCALTGNNSVAFITCLPPAACHCHNVVAVLPYRAAYHAPLMPAFCLPPAPAAPTAPALPACTCLP